MHRTRRGSVVCDGAWIYLQTPFPLMGRARLIRGGRFDSTTLAFRYPQTREVAKEIVRRFGWQGLHVDHQFKKLLRATKEETL
ncbi:hypothetical protein [Marininema halotolerans]|uniref:Uncharacterized protein n=1 Tax=Marininema halotolerans TaxID=1155944 RepID=A0A1I6SFQ4_9BACL|nr:hypothetical protein [Marininema halotolerans]SFS75805.1 hypothetical protein SAMN05444972_10753 [Marininema halotolerans]